MEQLKKISAHHIVLYEKTILVNSMGYFHDFLLEDFECEIITDIAKLKKDRIQILKHPSYEDIQKNFDRLINSSCIVVLNAQQSREIGLLGNYFKVRKMPFIQDEFLRFIGVPGMTLKEIEFKARTNNFHRIIYFFLKMREKIGLNPTIFYGAQKDRYDHVLSKNELRHLDSEDFVDASEYLSQCRQVDPNIFLPLAFHELTKYKDKETKLMGEIAWSDDIYDMPVKDFKPEEIDYLMKKGIVYKTREGKLVAVM